MTHTALPVSAGPQWGSASITKLLMALFLAFAGMLGVLQMSAPTASAQEATAYGAEVILFEPGRYTVNDEVCIPNNTGGTGEAVLGPSDDPAADGSIGATSASLSLGYEGSVTVRFAEFASGDGDPTTPDVWVWETGPAAEPYTVELSEDGETFVLVGQSDQSGPGSQGFDVDGAGFDRFSQIQYIRVTDTNGSPAGPCPDPGQVNRDGLYAVGSDIDAVGVITRAIEPSIELVKSSEIEDGTDLVAGGIITYTFTVTNTGNVDLSDVTVSDELEGLSEITPPSADIPEGDSATFTATYAVTQADIDNGQVVNAATVTGNPPEACEQCESPTDDDEHTTNLPQQPALTIEKTADTEGPVALGETIEYSFAVQNTGNVTLTDVTIADPLPGLVWVEGPNVGDLAPGEDATGTATYVTTEADVLAGGVTNSATVTGTPPESCVDCDPTSPPSEEIVTTEDPNPALEITKVASNEEPVELNEIIFYEFTATNTGNVTLFNVAINDPLPGLSPIQPASVDSLLPGDTATFTASYQVTLADMANGGVTNNATGTGTPPDTCVGCETNITNPPPVTVIVEEPVPALEITKLATNTNPVSAGDTITYEFTATNTGNVPLDNVTITDELPGLQWVTGPDLGALLPGDTTIGSATYVVTEADIANGGVVNSATGTGVPPADCIDCEPPTYTPPPVEVPAANPGIAFTKVADTEGPVNAGDVITYTFTATNTGNVPLEGVVINDAMEGLIWTSGPDLGTIGVGEELSGTATYTVTEADIANGSVANSATATCDNCGDGTPPSSVTVPTVEPGLALAKAAEPGEGVQVGDTITYTFTATNTGNVALENVTLTDALPGLTWVTGPELGALGIGDEATGTATYVVTQADVNAGGVFNSATATGTGPGGEITSPPSEVTVPTEVGTMGLALDKTVSPDTTVEAGDTVTYTFVVTNVGTTTAENIGITDILPGLSEIEGPHGTALEPGETATFTATYVVTEADAVLGILSNTATATGNGPGGEALTAVDTARVRACMVPQPEDEADDAAESTPTVEPTVEPTELPGTPEAEPTAVPTEPVDAEPTEPVEAEPTAVPTEEPPVDEPPVEAPPVDAPPAEDPPAEAPPVDEPPAEDPPAEEPPVDEPPAEAPPVEDPPADAPPAEDPVDGETGETGDPAASRGQPVTRILLQDAGDDDLADCVPLPDPVEPDPDPDPVAPAPPAQPAPPTSGGGGGGTSGGGPVVSSLPSTGQAHAQDALPGALVAGGLVAAALALGAIGLQVRRTRQP